MRPVEIVSQIAGTDTGDIYDRMSKYSRKASPVCVYLNFRHLNSHDKKMLSAAQTCRVYFLEALKKIMNQQNKAETMGSKSPEILMTPGLRKDFC